MDNKFIIIVASRNNELFVQSNIDSILSQDYINYKVIYFNDASDDKTKEKANELVISNDKFNIINFEKRQWKSTIFSQLESYVEINNNDILVFLDGDDMFSSENVLSYLNEIYNQSKCWMTYGGMTVWNGGNDFVEPYPQNTEIPSHIVNNKAYRKDTWRTSHLKSMRGFIWKAFDKKDLVFENNPVIQDDFAIMMGALELCPPFKVHRIKDPVYIYNHTPENNHSRGCKETKESNIDFESIIRQKTPYETISTVSPTLAGGLGNQLFEIAAAASLAKDNNALLLVNNNEHILPNQGKNVNSYRNNILSKVPFGYIVPDRIYNEPGMFYINIPYSKGNLKLNGHFQSFKHFDHNREYIQNLFSPTREVLSYIIDKYGTSNDENITGIQVRRGDYWKFPDAHPLLSKDYFMTAMEQIDSNEIWIFSDDIQWCKDNLNFNKTIRYIKEEDYIELYMMSFLKNLIISNSSFGWWGSYLNKRENKKIIAPKNWFGPALIKQGFNYDELIPKEWITL